MTQSKVHVALDTLTLSCTAEEIAAVFDGMLREIRAALPFLTADDREALRRIMADESGSLTVGDVFPDYARDSEDLLALRRLRTAQFVRPGGRDRWDRDTVIEVKPFARLAWDRLGEAVVFGEAEQGEAAPDVEEIDLSLPGVDAPDEAVTVRPKKTKVAEWEDDDVLDFLKDGKGAAG